ncbi:hypothetical protein [Luteimonas sp. A482]
MRKMPIRIDAPAEVHTREDALSAFDAVLERLVALDAAQADTRGHVRWLRPEF